MKILLMMVVTQFLTLIIFAWFNTVAWIRILVLRQQLAVYKRKSKRPTLAKMARDIFYETDWGNVRPSWHVQCASMSTHYLGEEFDIHTGGTDILFPHNENEIAQCAALYGKGPARYWPHSELVPAGGRKMSRSE
jgi:cysteinyl-tRNA synthetase